SQPARPTPVAAGSRDHARQLVAALLLLARRAQRRREGPAGPAGRPGIRADGTRARPVRPGQVGPMPMSFRRKPGPQTTRSIVVDGQQLRIDVRPAAGRGTPLLLVNGIGASLELLQPFVDALDPAVEV